MKKLLSAILATMIGAGLMSGCGAAPSSSSSSSSQSSSEASVVSSETPAASDTASEAQPEAVADPGLPTKMILGLDASFPPMGFTDENNQVVGADIDLAKAVCEKLGMEFEAKPIAWDSKEMEIATDKISCVWNGMTITDERIATFEMSRPYMRNDQVIVVMNDSAVKAKADLAGKKVAAQKDSSGLAALEKDEILASIDGAAAIQYDDYVTALGDLEVGRIDAIVMDSVVANYYITTNAKPMTILDEKMSAEEYGIGFKKGSVQFKDAVEGAIAELAAEGKLQEISQKWFGRDDMFISY